MKDFLTLKEHQQLGLNRGLLILSAIIYVTSSLVANYEATVNEAWLRWKYILMFDFILIFVAVRAEVTKLISVYGYRIILYTLINYYIDDYFGLKDWSWNDRLTIGLILIEALIVIIKNKK